MCEVKAKNKNDKLEKISIEVSDEEVNHRLDQIESVSMPDDLRDYLIRALKVLVELDRIVGLQKTTILRLRKIFGKKSEKSLNDDDDRDKNPEWKNSKDNPKGHGRNGHDKYQNIPEQYYPVQEYKVGDLCPHNDGGKLYEYKQRYHISITGGPPFRANRIIHQTLRCNICGFVIEAVSPVSGKPKYDVTVRSMLSILHYSSSFPMYRLDKLQKNFFTPMPRSVQWMLLVELGSILMVIYDVFLTLLSNSDTTIMSDDTKAKIQSHTNRINKQKKELARLSQEEGECGKKKKSAERVELSTTGMRTIVDGHEVIVFITGKKNSGENIDDMLARRTNESKMIVIGDASTKNNPTDVANVELVNCNTHARREFVDIEDQYKDEVAKVKAWYREIYKNEAYTKEQCLTHEERLLFHQTNSAPIMNKLKEWCDRSILEKKVEPNSSLGGAINYIRNHWPGLTGFLRIAGCPLDTNILEGYLRTPVMNRRNWLHLKTENGAFINDVNLSVIKSCEAAGTNTYIYLNALQDNEAAVRAYPQNWLPWNYKENHPLSPLKK